MKSSLLKTLLSFVAQPAAATENNNTEFSKLITDMRSHSRSAGRQVSSSMDTAIVAGGFDKNVKAIQAKTNDLHDQISSASSSVEQIAANVHRFNCIIERQDTALSQVSGAVEQMSHSVNSVTRVTRQKMDAAGKLRSIIAKGGESVNTTASAIAEVNLAIAAVSDVIKVINNIAAQTKFLAMNAAIEAAHAGEFGKGFAVVATEVTKLSESTAKNSKVISNSLQSIIAQIHNAKNASETAGNTFAKVQKEVEVFVDAFSDISNTTAHLTDGTTQIVSTVQDLQSVSTEIFGGSKEIALGSDSIDTALRNIKDFSNDLLDDIDTIGKKASDISGAQSGIAQYMVDTSKNTEAFYKKMVEEGQLEKENTLFNFDLVVLMHRNWLIQLRAFLDGRKENLKATPEDHLKCDLGRWIYSDGKQLSEIPAYRRLEEQHEMFHRAAGLIIQAKNEGNKELAEDRYQHLMNDYHSIVALLEELVQVRS
jgi:methyl-accepting chemotaxis protein